MEDLFMNILVLGNGFDLAHGLPTTYKDFLDFTHIFKYYYEEENKKQYIFSEKYQKYKPYILKLFQESMNSEDKKNLIQELAELIINNRWLEYFWQVNRSGGWIDFESEISNVIQALDRVRKCRNEQIKKEPQAQTFTPDKYDSTLLNKLDLGIGKMNIRLVENIKEFLLDDLNKLIKCLEIYLDDYVGQIIPQVVLPDIIELKIHCVLSFNYTDTYQKFYHTDENIDYDYIHGKINTGSSVESCQLILGIDEYLTGEDKRRDNEYIQFKKFYQRIYKTTGCKYVDWIRKVNEVARMTPKMQGPINNVYILGHSLDVTDGDIISGLINMPNTKTTIFHHSQEALGNQICNLVKILGEEELIEKVHGQNASIILKEQKAPVGIEK